MARHRARLGLNEHFVRIMLARAKCSSLCLVFCRGTLLLCVALQCCYISEERQENPEKEWEMMSNRIPPFRLFLPKVVVPSPNSHWISVACVVVSL